MSIAELIMQGTNRASNSTAWVGDSLAKLGQNVGQALAQREQQKQAQEMLPMFQQSMQESMRLAGQGQSGEAYAKLMPFITDPAAINNPYVLPAISAATKFIDNESNNFLRKEQLRVQEGMYGARSDYQNSLLALRENQATAKAEVDARKLGIQEQRLQLQREYYDAKDENEKARIDIQLQRLDLDEERLDSDIAYRQQKLGYGQDTSFQQSYEGAAGIGGPRSAGTPLTSTDRTTIEQAAQDVTNAVLLPDEVPQPTTGIPAMVAPTTETPVATTPNQPFTLESPAASFTQLGAQPYEPSERLLETFAKNSDKYNSASPKEKKQMNSERSIVYDNQDALKNDLPNLNTEQIGFTQVDAGVVDPELVGIKFLRNVEKSRNAQGKITGYEPNNGAAASIERLQTAFNVVNGRQDLRDLYANAGGWQNVEIKSVPASKSDIENVSASFEVINKKNREQKVLVTGKDAELLQSIEMVVPISNTNKMDRVYLKGQQPAAAPAPTQGGMPAVQAGAAKATQQAAPEELDATNPFAKKVSEQRASQQVTEAETSKTRTKDTIASLETKLKVLEKLATRKGFQPDDAANYKDYQDTKKKLDTLKQISVAESEGRVFASEAEARNSNKKFNKGTTIYIAGKPAVVQ